MKQVLLRTIVVLMLLAFAGIGAHILRPDYFIKRSSVRRGGEFADGVEPTLLSDSRHNLRWPRALYLLYAFFRQ
jgi:hypothetical protein